MREQFAIRVYKQNFNFGAAHFLIFADGSREQLHGHNYHVRVKVWGETQAGDLVLDFIKFKPVVRAICDDLDHRMLLPRHNHRLTVTEFPDRVEARYEDGAFFCFPAGDCRILELPNTSTEMLAQFFCDELLIRMAAEGSDAGIQAVEIEVEESLGQCGVYKRILGDHVVL
ncbi:MAG: 6-pyruvoyltetrahydropterin/6-carboxytetrahydropterin synthase [Myxococcota bacterium]|jgi:6-pyruvoyltetrahydropterin/6-carboxytetrahydropterin synthase